MEFERVRRESATAREAPRSERQRVRGPRAQVAFAPSQSLVPRLEAANAVMFAATTRIERATHDLASSEKVESAPVAGDLVIRRRVDIDFPTWTQDPAQANQTDLQKHASYFQYVDRELAATKDAYADLPAYLTEGIKQWRSTALAELHKLRPDKNNGVAPTAPQLQTWRTDYLDVLVAMVKDLDDTGKMVAGQADAGAQNQGAQGGQAADAGPAWTDQAGRFVLADDDAIADFRLLVAALDKGALYKNDTGSIVGGYKGKKVAGLNDPSARIDAQMPPGPGLFNIQYQADNASFTGVLFSLDDAEPKIIEEFWVALGRAGTRVSPLYTERRNAPKAKVTLSKKEKEAKARANFSKK